MRRLGLAILLLTLLAALAGCGNSTTGPGASGSGQMRMTLTDAPADFDSVMLVIREVAVHAASPDSANWIRFVPAKTYYDLLTLRNGVFAELGTWTLPAGHYTQVRLLLDPGSYLVIGGQRVPLTVPSGLQTGLKLIGEFDVPAGSLVDLGLEFDAARSVHETGNGRWMLKPTVRLVPRTLSGAIVGRIAPADTASSVFAIMGADTIGWTRTGTDGAFAVSLLLPGTYDVAIDAPVSLRDTTLTGVSVVAGQATNVGTVTLPPK
jgi:hypothetical protein